MRRSFSLAVGLLVLFSMLLSGCAPAATPQVIEKEVIREVTKEVEVVKEVEKEVQVTVVVEKEKVVEKAVEVVVTATPVPTPSETAKLSFWINYNFDQAVNVLIKSQIQEWAKAHNAEVDVLIAPDTDLAAKWAAGLEAPSTLPDVSVIFNQWMPKFYEADLLLDVSDAFESANAYAGGFFPAAKEVMTIGGKQWAVPYIGSVTPAYWRIDKLEEAGLTEPPDTFEEMKDFCAKVNVPGEFWCYGFAFGGYSDPEVQMRSLLWSYGASEVAEDGKTVTINSPETLAALTWLKEMQDMGSFPPDAITGDDAANNKYYQTRMVATIVNTGSVLSWVRTNDEELLDMTMLVPSPGGPAGRHAGAAGFGGGLGVFKHSKHPDLAKSLVVWFAHPDRTWARSEAVKFGNLPVHVDAAKDPVWDDPYLKPFIEQLNYGHPIGYPGPSSTAAYEVQNQLVVSRMAIRVVSGEQTPEQSMLQAEQEIKKIYEQFPPKL